MQPRHNLARSIHLNRARLKVAEALAKELLNAIMGALEALNLMSTQALN